MIISASTKSSLSNGASYYDVKPVQPAEQAVTPSYEQLSQTGGVSLSVTGRGLAGKLNFVERRVPTVDLTNSSLSSGLRAQDAIAAIESRRYSSPIDIKLNYGARFAGEQGQRLGRIYQSLLEVRAESGALRSISAYNIKTASVNNGSVLSATASQLAPAGDYSVTVTRLANSQKLASSAITNPGDPLGLSGTFKVNGWEVSVTSADTLDTLRDKINYGEDANHSGRLDYAADVNGNGAIEVLTAPGGAFSGGQYLPSFYWNEGATANGALSASEDANGNDILDGGSARTGVKASVAGGQLVLQSLDGGNIGVRLDDQNGILEAIGVLLRGPDFETAVNFLNDQTEREQTSKFSVNGTANESPSNYVHNGVGGLQLALGGTGSATVSVGVDATLAVKPTERFGGSFNAAMELLNSTIAGNGALSDNPKLQDIYADVVRALYTAPAQPAGGMKSVADAGITPAALPNAIQQLALEQAPSMMDDAYAIPGTGPDAWTSQVKKAGVDSVDDFKVDVDRNGMEASLKRNNAGVSDIMSLAASRLQSGLDRHLNPEHGTIKFQQDVIARYGSNQREVEKLMAQTASVAGTAVTAGTESALFRSVGAVNNRFSAVSVKA